jgi:hypothetical protein
MLKESGVGTQVPTKAEAVVEVSAPFIDLGALGSDGSRIEVRLDLGAGVILSIARG